ncbi:MAG: rod shape-determining protein RodA [Acidimicrobiales bacterium]
MTILSEHRPAPGRHRPVTKAQLALRFDYVLLLSTLFIAAMGALMVYSATRDNLALAGDDPRYYLKRQAFYVVVGALVMGVVAVLDYHWLEHASAVIYVVVILGLLSMFVIGSSPELGATRWLQLPGGIQVQPSAFATLGMIVMVATYCSRRPDGITFSDLLKILALVAIPIVLVAKQPDLGSAIVMSVVLIVMLVVAGIPGRYLLLLLALCAIGAFGVIHLHLLKPYQVQRLTGFIDQKGKVTQVTYTLGQSESAIANGGFWGTGLFHGAQTNLSYVPEQKTDFIFSAVGEQLGFVGTAIVLLLFGLVSGRVLRAAQTARDSFGRLLAAGVFTLLAFSIFENVGMSMGIMPIAGIPLPFFSYGGSAIVAFFAAVGVALSVNLRRR